MPTWVPYPDFVNPGDNAWQLTAATLVGLMSVPGLVVLYAELIVHTWTIERRISLIARYATARRAAV